MQLNVQSVVAHFPHLKLHEKDESIICPECGDEFGVRVSCNHQFP